ncbi:helix-turn-helix domain-containing protein [Chloroflexota bacterium]
MEKTNYDKHREELFENPEFRRKYEALEPRYNLIRALIRRRNELQLSQVQLASIVGMQQPTISRLENGGCDTSIGTLLKVVGALGLDVEFKPKETIRV